MPRRPDPERNAEQADQVAGGGQLERRGNTFDNLVNHRTIVLERASEVELKHIHDPLSVLHRNWIVEPVAFAELLEVLLGNVGILNQGLGSTRSEACDNERDQRDAEQQEERLDDSADDESSHGCSPGDRRLVIGIRNPVGEAQPTGITTHAYASSHHSQTSLSPRLLISTPLTRLLNAVWPCS